MIVFLLTSTCCILFLLVWFKVVPFNLFWKISPLLGLLVAACRDFSFRWAGERHRARARRPTIPSRSCPTSQARSSRFPSRPTRRLRQRTSCSASIRFLFRRRSTRLMPSSSLPSFGFGQLTQLQRGDAGRAFDVQQRDAEVKQLKAQLAAAKWNLDKTIVRAPADGYVTNLALRKGARVSSLPLAPVMAFIDTSDTLVGAEIAQIYARYIEPGQKAEVTFKLYPGRIFTGRVETVLQAISTGQSGPRDWL